MYEILELTNKDDCFYRLLGPVMGSRKIAKEVGIHCYADDEKIFYVAVSDRVHGLLSIRSGVISDCYVVPEFRRSGVLSSLLSMAIVPGKSYRATCTPMSVGAFEKMGFKKTKETKNFTFVGLSNA